MWQSLLGLVALFVGVVHSWDFAVSVGDKLVFYNTDRTKLETVHFESQHLTALAYDEVRNMMLYVDKQSENDAICGYNLFTMEYKYLIERNGRNIQGLAYDPATEKLFFTDTNEKSLNWISLKPGFKNNVYGNLLIKMDEGIPTDIAVDSCRGYIYWINTNLTKTAIERARFDGSERELVLNPTSLTIDTNYRLEPHSLAIDPQTQQMYWVEPEDSSLYSTYRADLNGKNKDRNSYFHLYSPALTNISKVLAVTKNSLISWKWTANGALYEEPKISYGGDIRYLFMLETAIPAGIAANYKIEQQTQGIQDCQALKSLVRDNTVTDSSMKNATEYDGPFCAHGMKVNGQYRCKCAPGYTGERCDVSECKNYCLFGNCSVNDEGLPICSCPTGYTGPRCEFNACNGFCSNNGDCSLNDNREPVCHCKEDYSGDRCELSGCLNYCLQGNCSLSDEGLPTCSCNAGFTGGRCEVSVCHGYCLNDGVCSLNEEDEAVCECVGDHEGSRCEVDKSNSCTVTNTLTYYSAQKNLSLADLLSNWRKPTVKVSVNVEV